MQQVHGNNVVVVDRNYSDLTPNCDGLITSDPEVALVVQTADCMPISIVESGNKTIGLIHVGWRGLKNGIIKNAVNLMKSKKLKISRSRHFVVKIGPHICQKCYEVQDGVASQFSEIKVINNKKYLSLKDEAIKQLLELGIKRENIEIDKRCTYEDLSLPSYRRGDSNRRVTTKLYI